MGHLFLGLTIVTTVISQLLIKWRVSAVVSEMSFPSEWLDRVIFLCKILFDPFLFLAICLTFVSGLCWIATMSKLEIGYAYPFTLLGFVSVIFISSILFGENMNIYRLVGCGIIVIGVIVTSRGL